MIERDARAGVDFVADRCGPKFRVYWTRTTVRDDDQQLITRKEVRENLTREEANSLCASVAAQGFMPFVAQSFYKSRA
jgi:uncharacterized protein (DUF2164 family)